MRLTRMGVQVSNEWDDPDDGNDGQQNQNQNQNQNQGNGLRKQLEAAIAANKAQTVELNKLKAEARTSAVAKVLEAKKVNAKVAKLVPADVEPTTEAVEKWLDEFGDVFGIKAEEPEGENATPPDPDADAAAQAYIAAMRQMGTLTTGALTPSKEADLLAKIM